MRWACVFFFFFGWLANFFSENEGKKNRKFCAVRDFFGPYFEIKIIKINHIEETTKAFPRSPLVAELFIKKMLQPT